MVDSGKMKRQDQQHALIKRSQHTDSLVERFHTASQYQRKHILFCLPSIMPAEEEDTIEANGARVMALQALNGHKICKSALMDLIFARKKLWETCYEHLQSGTVPVYGLKDTPQIRGRGPLD
jgi:hypothetical protein